MRRRPRTVVVVAGVVVALAVAAGCTSDAQLAGEAERTTSTLTSVKPAGPDIDPDSSIDDIVAALQRYVGPYRITTVVAPGSAQQSTTVDTFDGESWSWTHDPPSPVEEKRAVRTATGTGCFARTGDTWAGEDVDGAPSAQFLDRLRVEIPGSGAPWNPAVLSEGAYTVARTNDGMSITPRGASPELPAIDRAEFVMKDRRLVSLRLIRDGEAVASQTFEFTGIESIVAPGPTEPGLDVEC